MKQNDITLVREKHAQLDELLPGLEADAWLVLTREHSDVSTELFTGLGLVGEAAFLFTRTGKKYAIVADYDVHPIELPGVFEVVAYGKGGFMAPLTELLERVAPQTLALNFSDSDPLADGLTVGMLNKLKRAWPVEGFEQRVSSAQKVLADLRALKSPEEVRRIREAVRITELVFDEVGEFIRPGRTEIEIAEFIKTRHRHYGVTHSFGDGANVAVGYVGMGHRPVGDHEVVQGDTVVIDMGVYYEGYTSDVMRTWYVRRDDETEAPAEIKHRFDIGKVAMEKVFAAMKPGVAGWELDKIARDHQAASGIEPYTHALGHQIGRAVHDGGTTLAPLNPRYGERGKAAIRAGEVYTIEPVVHGRTGVDGSPVGHEQDVLVTEDGIELLSHPPAEIYLV